MKEEPMAVTFEFRRHSIKDGPTSAAIGPKGYALAREVGARQLRGRAFTDFYASPVWRTHQTLAAFAEGAGDFRLKWAPPTPPIYAERPEVRELWRACRAAELRGEDMVLAALARDEGLFRRLADELAALFVAWAPSHEDGRKVIVVGHSPHLEIMAFGLDGALMPGLKECQGFRFVADGGRVVERGAPDLDPSAIRQALFP
jgi:phosphohistidine phosphatase SixA